MKTKKFLILAAAATAFAACSNDSEPTNDNAPVEAQISASINNIGTRAAGTEWADNDEIGISTTNNVKTSYANIPYKWNGTNFEASSAKIYFQSMDEVEFSAYYPFSGTSGTAEGTITATTDADNQTSANQPQIDFLFTSGAKASRTSPNVNFTGDYAFQHKMSQITLTFSEGDDIKLADLLTAYTLDGLKLSGTFNTADGATAASSDATATKLEISLSNVTVDDKGQYAAPSLILFPQDITDGNIPLTVTVNEEVYGTTLKLPTTANSKLESGNNYTFLVKVSKTGLTVQTASIDQWNDVKGDDTTAEMIAK